MVDQTVVLDGVNHSLSIEGDILICLKDGMVHKILHKDEVITFDAKMEKNYPNKNYIVQVHYVFHKRIWMCTKNIKRDNKFWECCQINQQKLSFNLTTKSQQKYKWFIVVGHPQAF